jgi:hypothetical protein
MANLPGESMRMSADRAARRAELERVAEQIGEHLQHPVGIRVDRRQPLGDLNLKRQPLLVRYSLHHRRCLPHQFRGRLLRGGDRKPAGFQAADVEQVLDKRVHLRQRSQNRFGRIDPPLVRELWLLQKGGVHGARAEGISQIVRHNGEDLVACTRCFARLLPGTLLPRETKRALECSGTPSDALRQKPAVRSPEHVTPVEQ